jgi:hypothetical protein
VTSAADIRSAAFDPKGKEMKVEEEPVPLSERHRETFELAAVVVDLRSRLVAFTADQV